MMRFSPTPLIAIVRGIRPAEAEAIAAVIAGAGFGATVAPLNRLAPHLLPRGGRRNSPWLDRPMT